MPMTQRLIHLSDLHFGREDLAAVEGLHRKIQALAPDRIIISGDLTQRARRLEFQAARAFLDALPCPWFAVPGNHDIPLYNVMQRLANPLHAYRRWISTNLHPVWIHGEIAIFGINTVLPWRVQQGGLTSSQLQRLLNELQYHSRSLRLIVSHHPLGMPAQQHHPDCVDQHILENLLHHGADIFLSGHLHQSALTQTVGRYHGRQGILVHAGSAISERLRGENNAFNVLDCQRDHVHVTTWEWQMDEFTRQAEHEYLRCKHNGWREI